MSWCASTSQGGDIPTFPDEQIQQIEDKLNQQPATGNRQRGQTAE